MRPLSSIKLNFYLIITLNTDKLMVKIRNKIWPIGFHGIYFLRKDKQGQKLVL